MALYDDRDPPQDPAGPAGAPDEPEQAQTLRRQGWKLPAPGGRGGSPDAQHESASSQPSGGRAPEAQIRDGVIGQVSNVSVGMLESTSVPVVTYRLERNDPHAGRSFVASLRLQGDQALGFADVGDWLEAKGKAGPAHLVAGHCINHSTGAVFDRRTGRHPVWTLVVLLAIVAAFAAIGLLIVRANDGPKPGQLHSRVVERCAPGGATSPLCESAT